jgi:hypothetical protein
VSILKMLDYFLFFYRTYETENKHSNEKTLEPALAI